MNTDTSVVSPTKTIETEPQTAEFVVSNAYRYYVVWLLFAVYLVNFVDRQILSILNEELKHEFNLTDTQLGLLGGFAFAVLYSTLGIPIAKWADRGSRVNIISLAIIVWSAFTALTAGAKAVWHLVIARIGVGIGEAGCSPPAYSIISDYFEQKRRATALSIYSMGVYGGGFAGMFLGSYVGDQYGWRAAFLVAGLPGIALALVVKLTLREPPRGFSDPPGAARAAAPPVFDVLKRLWSKSSFRWLAIGAALHTFAAYGVGHFYGSFLIRSHGLTLANVGPILGSVVAIGGLTGTFLGGYLSDYFVTKRNDIRYYLFVPAILLIVYLPFGQLVYTLGDRNTVLVLMTIYIALSASYLAPNLAATHRLVTVRERAMASALFLFIINLVGMGFGPTVAGFVSDLLRDYFVSGGDTLKLATADGLRISLQILILINVFSIWFYFIAARKLREEAAA